MKRIAILCVLGVLLLTFQVQAHHHYYNYYNRDIIKIFFEYSQPKSQSILSFPDLKDKNSTYGYDAQVGFTYVFYSFGQSLSSGDERTRHSGIVLHAFSQKLLRCHGLSPFADIGFGYEKTSNKKRVPYDEFYVGIRGYSFHIGIGLRNSTLDGVFIIKLGFSIGD